ncbi:MAG TPA: ABC transporter substrate-binding protein, partial [Blastocatellia bacterium]|nr:ABC transporter substrate-binding protein [Blastocatellia bacterium]
AIERIAGGDLAPVDRGLVAAASSADTALLMPLDQLARQLRRVVFGLRRAAGSIEMVAADVHRGTKGLSQSVKDEGASIANTTTSMSQISHALLDAEGSIGALSELAQATSQSAAQVAHSIDDVSDHAEGLAGAVDEMARSIEAMTSSIQAVAANTDGLAALSEDTARAAASIDESTQRIDVSINETNDLGDVILQSAQKGSSVVYETARTMQNIKQAIDRATESITSLGSRGEQVGAITHVIDEIAERTNLLALNAAVLAVQAGPHGRGFRIVADEIKELSERTAASTREISSLIQSVQSDVYAATERVAFVDVLAEKGVDQAYSAAACLDEINDNTVRASHKIRGIAESTSVQAKETHRVVETAESVRQRAGEIQRATAEQAQASARIGDRAVHMSELTAQLRKATDEQADAAKRIAGAMEELSQVVVRIRGAVGEQSTGASLVLRAIETVSEVVARNQASIATINGAVDALGHEASLLRKEVEHFRLPAPRPGGHLTVGFRDTDVDLDPLRARTAASAAVLDCIFETLVRSGEGAEIEPALAAAWEVSADGIVYTFRLRDGARFHNGRGVTSHDVRYSFERVVRYGSNTGGWVFGPVLGSDEFASGRAPSVAGIETPDDRTVRITLKQPLAFFLATLCVDYASVVPREEVERDHDAFAQKPVGSGPYRVVSFEPSRRVEMVRAGDHSADGRPYADRMSFEMGLSDSEIVDRFAAGDLAYVKNPPSELVSRLNADASTRGTVLGAVRLHTERLIFDCASSPFDNPDVRRAFCHAIDKERYVREVHGDAGVVAHGRIPPGLFGYDAGFAGLEYDPDRSRSLLGQAGVNGTLRTSIWSTLGYVSQAGTRRIVEDLEAIGVDAEIRVVEPAEFVHAREHGTVPVAWRSWYADYPDADNFIYVLFHSSNQGLFSSHYASPEVDELAERARAVFDSEDRAAIYQRASRIIVADAPSLFLMHRRVLVAHQPDVEGLRLHLVTPVVRPEELWFTQ